MARIRTLKAEFFRSEDASAGGLGGKILFAGLACSMADDDGRFKASAGRIKGEVFTHDDVTDEEILGWLKILEDREVIWLYEVDGKPYGAFRNWKKHQPVPPSRYTPSSLPPPPTQTPRKQTASRRQASRRHAPGIPQASAKQTAGAEQADDKQTPADRQAGDRHMLPRARDHAGEIGTERIGDNPPVKASPSPTPFSTEASPADNGAAAAHRREVVNRVLDRAGSGVQSDDLDPVAVAIVKAYCDEMELAGPRGTDVPAVTSWLVDYRYLDEDTGPRQVRDHIAWLRRNGKSIPAIISAGFQQALQRHNDWLADHGGVKRR
jgi:hypothetical protein